MRIVGLDIGSTSVKAVEVEMRLGRFWVHEYHDVPVPEGTSAVEAAARLIHSLPKTPDKIVTALRSNRVTFRNPTFPTRDRKAIAASVMFELEDDLPFEIEDAAYDFVTLGTQGAETQVHVAATLKKTIEDYLVLLTSAGVDPDVLTTESCAYRALMRKITPHTVLDERPIMLAQIGHEHTTLYIQVRGVPLLTREIPFGGRELNIALSKRYNLSVDSAEKTKIDNGFVLPLSQMDNVSDEQRDFAGAVYDALQSLIREIRQADLSCKNLTQQRVSLIYLAGGSSLLPGLPAVISEDVKIPTQPLRALSSMGGSGVTYSEQTDAKFALAAGAALAGVTSEKPYLINFRKGEFGKAGKATDLDLGIFRRPLRTLAIASAALIALLAIENQIYSARLEKVNSQLEKAVRSYFQGINSSKLRSYVTDTNSLKKNVEAELNREREIANLLTPNPNSPFEFLREMSSSVPRDLVTDLMKFQVGSSTDGAYTTANDDSKLDLTFTVDNRQVAENLTKLMSQKVRDMKRSEITEVKAADGSPRWQVTFTGRPQEVTSGK